MSPATPGLTRIGSAVLARADAILLRWYELADADAELSTASTLSRAQFRDHIPEVLEAFAQRLGAVRGAAAAQAATTIRDSAASHGVVRWQQGYRQRELMREWRHLHLVLVQEIETIAASTQGLEPRAIATARFELARLVSDGICESASQYARLQEAEAEARLRDLEQAVRELQGVQRTTAELVRQATHDLRGGLGVVHLATAALRGDAAETQQDAALDMAERGIESMRALLDELIRLGRLEAGRERVQREPFDAAALLSDLGTAMRPLAAARQLELVVEGDAALHVEGDPAKVRRIAQNLLQNALRYTARGQVRLTWSEVDARPLPKWCFVVQDTGPGLAAGNAVPIAQALKEATDEARQVAPRDSALDEVVAELPEAEGRRTGEPPGEGIGLAIVKRLCELLDAQLELHTEPGTGSTFRVVLPRRYG
jgi:signal transduction histidine kinase